MTSKQRLFGLRDIPVVAAYLILTFGFFWQLIFLPDVQVPVGGGDLASFLYPVYSFAAESLQNGSFPFWNPYLYSGSPFAADMQSGIFYPINLLAFFLFRPFTYQTLEALAVTHYFLGAVFTYIFVRGLSLNRIASFGAGIIFAFSGFTVAHLGHLNMLEAAIWLPLILFFLHRSLNGGRLIWALSAGIAFGISILAGHIQISLYFALFLALYWLWSISSSWLGKRERRLSIKSVVSLPICYLTALGLSAPLLIPAFELARLSLRSELTFERATEFAASPMGFMLMLLPRFFGENAADFWAISGNLTEVYGYVGVSSLLFGVVGFALVKKSRWALFFAMSALLFLLLSLGERTVLFGWLYRFVPGFDKVRSAGRFVLFLDFSMAILAAYGIHAMSSRLSSRIRPYFRLVLQSSTVLLGASILLAAPFFYQALLLSQDKDPAIFRRVVSVLDGLNLTLLFFALGVGILFAFRYLGRNRVVVPYLALALIVIDLFSANAGYNPTAEDVTVKFQHSQAISFLKQEAEPFRIDTMTDVWDAWQPNLGMLEGIDDVMGIYNPMMLADYDRYWANLGKGGLDPRTVPAYDLLNVKYVVAHKDVALDWDHFEPALTDADQINIYRNRDSLPRALLVPKAKVMERDEMLAELRSPQFDPTKLVLLETEALLPSGDAREAAMQPEGVTYDRPDPNQVIVTTRSDHPAYLVLNEMHYPGWSVTIDDQQATLLRANFTFRAVAVPAGEHVVRFHFQPKYWTFALVASGLTVVIAIALAFFAVRPGRKTDALEETP